MGGIIAQPHNRSVFCVVVVESAVNGNQALPANQLITILCNFQDLQAESSAVLSKLTYEKGLTGSRMHMKMSWKNASIFPESLSFVLLQ